jgi:hypothetical protein
MGRSREMGWRGRRWGSECVRGGGSRREDRVGEWCVGWLIRVDQ